jgi:hypothetical protein
VEVAVRPGEVAIVSEVTGPHLELSQLRETLRTGSAVPVTFAFRDAGTVTLIVPVGTYTDVRPDKYLEPADATTRWLVSDLPSSMLSPAPHISTQARRPAT